MLNYFVYKNGQGNFFKPLTDKHHVLYVGFGHRWTRDGVVPKAVRENAKDAFPWGPDDLNHILFVSDPDNRADHLLLTFEKTELRFWRVTGEVRLATEMEWECAAAIQPRHPLDRYFGKGRVEQPPIGDDDPTPFRVLPVQHVASVPRDALYTSVDSLASYQYLIRGTCRPLWRATGPTAAPHHEKVLEHRQKSPVPRCERIGEEEPFAAFVRLYLNELLHRYAPATDSPSPRLGDFAVDLDSATKVVVSTLNPILVETAALAFVQDLRLTPDIGVGKGKDVIDVRARAAGSNGSFDAKIAEDAWATLQALNLKTAEGDNTLRDKLLTRGVLDIQCKAADRDVNADGVLYFGFKGPGHDGLTAILLNDLETLLGDGAWPNLRRFLAMQARILLGEWQSPSVDMPAKTNVPASFLGGVPDAA